MYVCIEMNPHRETRFNMCIGLRIVMKKKTNLNEIGMCTDLSMRDICMEFWDMNPNE